MNALSTRSSRQPQTAPLGISFEFFPPKNDAMAESLWASVQRLGPLSPRFVSVTYGAGALNMVNAVAAAYAEKSPLVLISGAPGQREGRGGQGLFGRHWRVQVGLFRVVGRLAHGVSLSLWRK